MIPELVQRCLVCGENLISDPDKVCGACQAPYHSDCWKMNEGCARMGCINAPKKERIDQGSVDIIIPPEQLPMRTKLWALAKSEWVIPFFSFILEVLYGIAYPFIHPVDSIKFLS